MSTAKIRKILRSRKRHLTIGAVILLLILLIAGLMHQAICASNWAQRAYRVHRLLVRVENLTIRLVADVRAFAVTGDPSLLDDQNLIKIQIRKIMRDIERATHGDVKQAEQASQLAGAIEQRLAISDHVIDLQKRHQGAQVSYQILKRGLPSLRAVHASTTVMLQEGQMQLYQRLATFQRTCYALAVITFVGATIFIVLLLRSKAELRRRLISEMQVSRELLASQELLKLVVEHGPNSIAVFDRQMRYLMASNRWIENLALDREQLIGRSHYEIFPNLPEAWKDVHRRCLVGGIELSDGERVSLRDGNEQWLRWEVRPWRDAKGGIGGLTIFMEDVTAAKLAEAELRESEQHFRALANSMPQIVWTCGPDGLPEYFNERWYELFGIYRNATRPQGWEQMVFVEDRPAVLPQWRSCLAKGEPFQAECRLLGLHEDSPRWYLVRAVVVAGVDGGRLRWFGTCTDIHEQKASEERLAASETLMRRVIEGVVDGVITIAEDGRILSWNSGAERIFRYRPEAAIGTCITQMMPADDAKDFGEYLNAAPELLSPKACPGLTREVEGRRADGEPVAIEVSVSAIHINQKMIFVAVIRDLTDRKAAEAERIAREAAESANQAKSAFLANMSHEIRTPMNGIIGLTELSLQTQLSKQQSEYLLGIQSSAVSLLSIINDILDFSKIEAGKLDLNIAQFDLYKVVGSILKSISPRAHASGLELICRIAPDVPVGLLGDPCRLGQILTNLLGNAVKFTPQGVVELMISLADFSQQANLALQFSVKDTGIGIATERLADIFDPFVQGDRTTTRTFGGTGLGLSISKRLVDLMGGHIQVSSQIGHGSEFCFILPLQESYVDIEKYECELSDYHALVVDDSLESARAVAELLEAWGANVRMLRSSDDWLEALQNSENNLILVNAACLDPVLLTKQLNFKDSERIVIAMTTFADRETQMQHCEAAGIMHWLNKPVIASELVEVLRCAQGYVASEQRSELATVKQVVERPLHVLLADDHRINQIIAKDFLCKWGHQVTLANDGEEALQHLAAHAFDLVLLDLCMPKQDGFAVIKRIRAREHDGGRRLPVIALTAQAMAGDSERCLAAGFDDYLSKPFDPQTLRRKITELMQAREVQTWTEHDAGSGQFAAAIDEAQIFDFELASATCGGDMEFLRELLLLHQQTARESLALMRQALTHKNAKEVAQQAHKMRGAAGFFGAGRVICLTQTLEQLAKVNDLKAMATTVVALEATYDEIARLSRQQASA